MKKVLSLMLISTLSLSLVACNKNDKINIDEFKIDDSAINLLNVGKEVEITNE